MSSSAAKDKAYADNNAAEVPPWALDVDGYCCFVKNI